VFVTFLPNKYKQYTFVVLHRNIIIKFDSFYIFKSKGMNLHANLIDSKLEYN